MGTKRTRMEATADALSDINGIQPEEVTLRLLVDQEVRELVNRSVAFELQGANLDRPDAKKYGTHPGGKPCHAPEWYVAQSIATAIHEGLYGVLCGVLSCEEVDEHGHHCIGSLAHETNCWDGNGCNWQAGL